MNCIIEEYQIIKNIPDEGTIVRNYLGTNVYVVGMHEDYKYKAYVHIVGQNLFYWEQERIILSTIFVKPSLWYVIKCKIKKYLK